MQGKLICLYGINNIGKSTQAHALVDALNAHGYSAVYQKYPIYELAPSGPFINQVLRGGEAQRISEEELQMWYTLNRFQNEPALKRLLGEGMHVVAEDYAGTGIAWGTAKGADMQWLETINRPLIQEDLGILLDGDRFLSGKEGNHIHESNDDLVTKCRLSHAMLAKQYSWPVVDANRAQAEVAADILQIVMSYLKARG